MKSFMKRIYDFFDPAKHKLRTSFISLAIVFMGLLFSLVTFAWFSQNKSVTASGMRVNVDADASCVIANSLSELKNVTQEGYNVTLKKSASHRYASLIPATHSASSESGLIFAVDPAKINLETGLSNDENEIRFSDVPESNNSQYYVDYTVYIGTFVKKINGATLTVQITTPKDLSSFTAAASADIYVGDTYKGTLNIAGYDSAKNDYKTTKTSINLGVYDIPYHTSNDAIKITFRCYYDGALLKSAGQCFIAQETISQSIETLLSFNINVVGGTEVK